MRVVRVARPIFVLTPSGLGRAFGVGNRVAYEMEAYSCWEVKVGTLLVEEELPSLELVMGKGVTSWTMGPHRFCLSEDMVRDYCEEV